MSLENYKELEILISKDKSIDFSNFLEQNSNILGYYEILFDKETDKTSLFDEKTKFKIYLSTKDSKTEISILIYLKIIDEFNHINTKNIKTLDYEEAYKEFYKEFSVGIFEIVPTWNKETFKCDETKIPLFINPGLAFGTGHHETTKLMLEKLSSLTLENSSILEIGTGSGILSIACIKKFAKSILALDIDENCITATNYNFKQNKIENPNFKVEIGSFDYNFQNLKFDLLLININFSIIEQNIDFIKKIHAERILFSGIIENQRENFINLLNKKVNGTIKEEKSKNEWCMFDFINQNKY